MLRKFFVFAGSRYRVLGTRADAIVLQNCILPKGSTSGQILYYPNRAQSFEPFEASWRS